MCLCVKNKKNKKYPRKADSIQKKEKKARKGGTTVGDSRSKTISNGFKTLWKR